MSYIVGAVLAVIIIIICFCVFSSEDREEEIGYLAGEDTNASTDNEAESQPKLVSTPKIEKEEPISTQEEESIPEEIPSSIMATEESNSMFQQEAEEETINQPAKPAEITRIHTNIEERPEPEILEVGTEDDLRLRMNLRQNLAKPVSIEKCKHSVVVAIQLRFPDEVIKSNDFIKVLTQAERVFEKKFTFDFESFQDSQFTRFLVFEPNEERDVIIESLIVAYEATIRFRKALEIDNVLRENKAKMAVGVSAGDLSLICRGANSEPTLFGKPAYLAETLCEVVGDFGIYVDSIVHEASLSLFDFREWKPTLVRQTLPPIPLYELIGWNKPEEIASFVKHEEASARKAVAIAYRYFELQDMHPLIELLSDSDQSVALEAIDTISYIGDDRMNGALKLRLGEMTNPDLRSKVIEAFGNAGNNSVMPIVLASTKESSWKVRLAATKALYKLSGKDAMPHLEAMLKDPDSIIRVVANAIFYEETHKPEYFNALIDFLGDASKRARATAVDCLMSFGSDKALKEITNVFVNQDLYLQKHILTTMLNSKSKILYQCFLTMFKNSSEALRPHIVEAVRRAGIVS